MNFFAALLSVLGILVIVVVSFDAWRAHTFPRRLREAELEGFVEGLLDGLSKHQPPDSSD